MLFVMAVYLGAGLINRKPADVSSGQIKMQNLSGHSREGGCGQTPVGALPDLSDIVKRNLFKAACRKGGGLRGMAAIPQKLEQTTLNLLLRGTVEGRKASYAVIEDPKIKQQSLYQTGDRISGALILEISRNRVVLRVGGKDQLLEAVTEINPPGKTIAGRIPDFAGLSLPDMGDELKKYEIPENQARFRRFSAGGKQKGLLVYNVNPASGFYRAGLKNGDVVIHVNDQKLGRTADARLIQKELASGGNIRMGILRRGLFQIIEYSAQTNESSAVQEEN
jgi:type II secretory pathway component PulC